MDCLIVTDQPEITVHPRSVAKTEEENVTLFCNATANPVPTILWTRDGSPVDTSGNSTRVSFSADTNKQLTITNVSRTDSGEYRCVARNSLGNDTSNMAKLDIQCKKLWCQGASTAICSNFSCVYLIFLFSCIYDHCTSSEWHENRRKYRDFLLQRYWKSSTNNIMD